MTKFEFLGDLSRLIADLPEEDREQAMEYYEDYFADAGPDREQEIIKEFISPAYIAEQLREASAQRLAEQGETAFVPPKTTEKPTVFSRKSAAQAAQAQNTPVTTPQTTPVTEQPKTAPATPVAPVVGQPKTAPATPVAPVAGQPKTVPATPVAPVAGQPKTAPATPVAPVAEQPKTAPATPVASMGNSDSSPSTSTVASEHNTANKEKEAYESLAMRNPIFQQRTAESAKKEEELLALKQKTKVDIKSINKSTSKMSKEDKKAAKQRAAEEKAYNASLYSGPKKAMVTLVLVITSPIILCVLGILLGLFVVALGLIVGLVALGIATVLSSIAFLFLTILAVTSASIPNAILSLGCALLLFAIGYGICFADYKLFTRVLPSAYYTILAQYTNIKAKLNRLTMK